MTSNWFRDVSSERSTFRVPEEHSVVVKLLPPTAIDKDLRRLFDRFGRIVSCRVMTNKYGKDVGFVNFDNAQSAEDAIHKMNDYNFNGRNIIVEHYRTYGHGPQPEPVDRRSAEPREELTTDNEHTIIVKGLQLTVKQRDVCEMFSRFGNILFCKVVRKDRTQNALVSYEKADAVNWAIASFYSQEIKVERYLANYRDKDYRRPAIVDNRPSTSRDNRSRESSRLRSDGRESVPEYKKPHQSSSRDRRTPTKDRTQTAGESSDRSEDGFEKKSVFVSGLPPTVDNIKLTELFGRFGPVVSSVVRCDLETGRSLGRGFVNFECPESVPKAIKGMHLTKYMGETITVNRTRETRVWRPNSRERQSADREVRDKRNDKSHSRDSSRSKDTSRSKDNTNSRESSRSKEMSRSKGTSKSTESSRSKGTSRSKDTEREDKPNETPTKSYSGTRLYVRHLGQYNNRDKLKQFFAAFGDITGVEISADKKADSGHVWFADQKEAENACKYLDGMPVENKLKMSFKIS